MKKTMAEKALALGIDECEIRELPNCINSIWRNGDEDMTEEYWLDVFTDGSAIEVSFDGLAPLTAPEAKKIAGRWKDWRMAIEPFLRKARLGTLMTPTFVKAE